MRLERKTLSNTLWVTKTTVKRSSCQSSQQVVVELEAGDLVECGERLVHQQQPRLGDQRAGDRDAHLHAAGKLARHGILEAGEMHARRASRGSRGAALAREMPRSLSGSQTLSKTLAQGSSVGSWKTKPMSDAAAAPLPRQSSRPEVGVDEAGDDAQRRRLAAAGRPEQAQEIALSGSSDRRRCSAVDAVGEDLADVAQHQAAGFSPAVLAHMALRTFARMQSGPRPVAHFFRSMPTPLLTNCSV